MYYSPDPETHPLLTWLLAGRAVCRLDSREYPERSGKNEVTVHFKDKSKLIAATASTPEEVSLMLVSIDSHKADRRIKEVRVDEDRLMLLTGEDEGVYLDVRQNTYEAVGVEFRLAD